MKKSITLIVLLLVMVLSGCSKTYTEPTITFESTVSTNESVSFELNIEDPDSVASIVAIELLEDGTVVQSFDEFTKRAFTKLYSDTTYDIKVIYWFYLNDNDGMLSKSITASVTTLSKDIPTLEITDVLIVEDTIEFTVLPNDIARVGAITKIELYTGDVLVQYLLNLEDRKFTGLESLDDYRILVTYTYDLNDNKGPQEILASYNDIEIETEFQKVFNKLDDYFPDVMTSNITLPSFATIDTSLTYDVDCTEIVRNRIEYTYPSESTTCNIDVSVTYNNETRSETIEIEMSGIEELPRIPVIHINTTGNASVDTKEEYVTGTMNFTPNENSEFEVLTNVPLRIKLRGNSTLFMPKRSYKIKFDEKQFFLADYKERSWVLLANFSDQTLIRNHVAYSMSENLGMSFTPGHTLVDVYLNGEYIGNYLLSDQIQVSSNRVNVEEKVTDIDTGYLIELDIGLYREGLENTNDNYFLVDHIPFVIKSPDYEDTHYSVAQKTFITDYVTNVYRVLERKEDYSELIDVDSFIDWFIVSEVFKNVDSGYSSVYFYKDKGGTLKMGPVWDYDLSSGNQGHLGDDLRGPEGWYTSRGDKNVFFYHLMQYPEFQEALKTRWNEVYDSVILNALDDIFLAADSITHSQYMNFQRWDIIGINEEWYTSPEVLALQTYDEQVWFFHDYLAERIAWMNNEIND